MEPSAPPAPLAQDVLAPAAGPLSTEEESFRRELFSAAQSAFVSSTPPGAVRTYEATLRVIASKVTAKLGAQVPPMTAEERVLLVSWFGGVAGAHGCPVGFSPARRALE